MRERRGFSANQTDVFIVWNPAGAKHRSTLQITVRKGKRPSEDVSRAMADLITAAAALQKAADVESEGRSPRSV